MPSATAKGGLRTPHAQISELEWTIYDSLGSAGVFWPAIHSAPGASSGKDGIGHDSPCRTIRVNRCPDRIPARVHIDRRRAVVVHRNYRGAIVAHAPRPAIGHDLRIGRAIGKRETVACIRNPEAGTTGAVEVDGLGGGHRTEPRHGKRQQGCFHRFNANKAQPHRLARGILT